MAEYPAFQAAYLLPMVKTALWDSKFGVPVSLFVEGFRVQFGFKI